MKFNADTETAMKDGRVALHLTSQTGATDVTKHLLDHQAKPNTVEGNGQTALHYAAYFGRSQIIDMLLQRGAVPDARTSKGSTALDIAERMGHKDVVASLAGSLSPGATRQNTERKVQHEFVTPAGADWSPRADASEARDKFDSNAIAGPPVLQVAGTPLFVREKTQPQGPGMLTKQKTIYKGKAA